MNCKRVSGSSHVVGRAFHRSTGSVDYGWTFFFDSFLELANNEVFVFFFVSQSRRGEKMVVV